MIDQIIVNGVLAGLIYVIMALGFTLVFGIMRIVNFAHGEFYMVGAMAVAGAVRHTRLAVLPGRPRRRPRQRASRRA